MKPRQTLRIIAPSGAMETAELLPTAEQRLSKLGFTAQLDAQCQLIHQRFAGSDKARAQALEAAILDPKVNIVMAARGGYGAHRLLPMLDWPRLAKAVQQQDKILVGHSDFTAIQLALLRHGAPSWAGPCAGVDFGGERVNPFMKREFLNASSGTFELTVKAKQTQPLKAHGMLWGGNLAMLCSLLGTPYFPKPAQIAGGILFLEDTNERPFRVERMLNQLHMAGILGSQSAVLWGDFGKPVQAPIDRGYGLNSVLKYLRDALKVPVVTGLPFGHTAKKASLPIGQQVQLAASLSGFHLELAS